MRRAVALIAPAIAWRSAAFAHASFIWLAAFALILQTALALNVASAATGVLDAASPAVICHSSSDGSPITIDPASKQCPQCLACVLGHYLAPTPTPAIAAPPVTAIAFVIAPADLFAPPPYGLHRPVERGPPTTA